MAIDGGDEFPERPTTTYHRLNRQPAKPEVRPFGTESELSFWNRVKGEVTQILKEIFVGDGVVKIER